MPGWNTDSVSVNTSTVRPHLAYNLSRYYHQTDNERDKEMCLELMEKLSLQRNRESISAHGTKPPNTKLTRRAKTPSPELRSRVSEKYLDSESRNPGLFYQTTTNKEFRGKYGTPAQNARPRTTQYSQPKLSEDTTYGAEYFRKIGGRSTPYRSGTSSGNRKNNPHPSDTFMVWKFAHRFPPVEAGTDLAEDVLEQVNKDNLKSIYQEDYTGLPQGFQAQTAYEGYPYPEWLDKAPHTLDTTTRAIYQVPYMPPGLQGNFTRYGCNGNRGIPSFGVVPTVSLNNPYMGLYSRTHYSDEFMDKSEKAFKDHHKKFKPVSLPVFEKYLKLAKPEEKEAFINLLKSIDEKDRFKEKKDKAWTSVWEGPL